jgi:CubicO group peptidase (beta-lactamase class C family)
MGDAHPEAAMSRIPLPSLVVAAVLALPGCGGGDAGAYPDYDNPGASASLSLAPENTGDGWSTSTPAAEGLDAQTLGGLMESIRDGRFPGVDSIVVVRNQRLVAEGYFNGYGRETLHDLRSTGKSFISTLAGIALAQGLVGLDDPMSQHIPDFDSHRNMSAGKRAITLRHLLNMHSGLECNDWDGSSPGNEERMYDSRDWIGFMLNLRMAAEPGTLPSYCTGGVVLLGHVVSLRSGMALKDYAQQWLLGPLDIQQSQWRHSPDGRATGATGFGLRPRDAAKLGALFVNEGVWNGARVVPESWVMTTRQRAVTLGAAGYGYLWWKQAYAHGNAQVQSVFAAGNGGNYVFMFPSLELVVAFTGSNYNTERSETPHQIIPLVLNALP